MVMLCDYTSQVAPNVACGQNSLLCSRPCMLKTCPVIDFIFMFVCFCLDAQCACQSVDSRFFSCVCVFLLVCCLKVNVFPLASPQC